MCSERRASMSGGIGGFLKAVRGVCGTKPLSPDLWTLEDSTARVRTSLKPDVVSWGGGVYLEGRGLQRPILVVRTDDDRYLAFTNRCTHIGHRKIDPVPGQRTLRCCSIFHSTFDYEGKRLSGPARDPLTRHEVTMDKGDLLIKL
jgi:cytochrome b6-f complex iron-sulfur subunit